MAKAGMVLILNWIRMKSPRILVDKKMSYFQVIPLSARFLIPVIASLQLIELSTAASPDISKLYIGCYKDNSGDRDLPHEQEKRIYINSIELCMGYCFSKGFRYAGLQATTWCSCGNTYGKHGESDCMHACAGDSSQKCGGPYKNSIYHAVSPVHFVGCYKGGKPRETSDDVITLGEGLTNSSPMCIHACQSKRKGYRYAAVQNDIGLCSCGYSLVKYGQPTGITECVNGVLDRNIIHKISGATNLLIGCFIDTSSRDLSPAHIISSKMTPLKCIKHCGQQGYRFAGTQAGHECFCGNSYGSHGEAKASDCNVECAGSGEWNCGGNWRNSIYRVDSEPEYLLGCFKNAMETDQRSSLSGTNTSATCKSACASIGFPYAAVHNYSSCTCGLDYESYQQSENRDCNKLCSGKSICGVASRASIYYTGVKPKTPTENKIFSSSNENKILIGHVMYSESHVPNAYLCIKYCMITDNCQSINYNSVTKVCQLNNAILTFDKVSAVVSGFWYYQAAHISHTSMMIKP